jgi:hypothetical protein
MYSEDLWKTFVRNSASNLHAEEYKSMGNLGYDRRDKDWIF